MSNPTLIINNVAEEAIAQYEIVAFGSVRGKVVKADGANAPFGVSCQPGTCAIGDRVTWSRRASSRFGSVPRSPRARRSPRMLTVMPSRPTVGPR